MNYGCTIIALAIFTLPYQRRFLYMFKPSLSPLSLIQTENERLSKEFSAYDQVEMLNGNVAFSAAYKGPYAYKSGHIYMGDVRLMVLGGEWISRGEDTGEYVTPANVTLRFTRNTGWHQGQSS